MNTIPTKHHSPRQIGLLVAATGLMAVLFLLFERSFMWLAAGLVVVTLLPVLPNDWSPREMYWRAFIAGALCAIGLTIWLT